MVFVHSQKRRNILKQLSDKIDSLEVNIEDAYRDNGCLVNHSPVHPERDEFLEQITADNFEDLVKKCFPQKSAKKPGILHRIMHKLPQIF